MTNKLNESTTSITSNADDDGRVVGNNEAAQDMGALGLFNQREKLYERAICVALFCVGLAIGVEFFKMAGKCGLTSNEPGCRG